MPDGPALICRAPVQARFRARFSFVVAPVRRTLTALTAGRRPGALPPPTDALRRRRCAAGPQRKALLDAVEQVAGPGSGADEGHVAGLTPAQVTGPSAASAASAAGPGL